MTPPEREALAPHLDTTWIDHEERALERPSDPAALLVDFHPTGPPEGQRS